MERTYDFLHERIGFKSESGPCPRSLPSQGQAARGQAPAFAGTGFDIVAAERPLCGKMPV